MPSYNRRLVRTGKRIGLGSITAVALVLASAAAASAAPATGGANSTPPGYRSVTTTNGDQILVPSGNQKDQTDKQAWLAAHPIGEAVSGPSSVDVSSLESQAAGSITTYAVSTSGSGTLSSTGKAAAGGNYIQSTGQTTASVVGGLTEHIHFDNSRVTATWLGSTPFNAAQIKPSMAWWLSGVAVSVSIPPSASFSSMGSGSGVLYSPGPVFNTWNASATYSNTIDQTAFLVYGANFQTYGDVLLGSDWYHVQGN